MKHIIISILFCLGFQSQSFAHHFKVYDRHKGELVESEVKLEDLDSDTSFDGKYFKIVKGRSEEAVSFESDEKVLLNAATTYYHLTRMRQFFLDKGIPGYDPDKKITIRIEMDKHFSDTNHYMGKELSKTSTIGALSVGRSQHAEKDDPHWEDEIWFYPKLASKHRTKIDRAGENVNARSTKNSIHSQMLYQEAIGFISDFIGVAGKSYMGSYLKFSASDHLSNLIIPMASVELLPNLFLVTKFFKKKRYIDTALVPEVIYHEYSHIVLKEVFGLYKSTTLNEGFPNYFAYKMSGLKKLAKGKKGVAKNNSKKLEKKPHYSLREDFDTKAANGSFTFSVLAKLDQRLSQTCGEEGSEILLHSLKYLNGSSDLRNDLPESLLRSIEEISKCPEAQKIELLKSLREMGL